MTSDLPARLVDAAVASVRAGKPLADVFGEVVGLAAAEAPAPAWDDIATVDAAADVAKCVPWLQRQPEERPFPAGTSELWFGLYVVRGPVPGRFEATLALSAGPGFADPDWRLNQKWEAPGYLPALGLRSVMPLAAAEDDGVRAIVAGPVVFAYSLALAVAVLDGVDPARLLGSITSLGIAVGAPDGQTVTLDLTPDGLDRSSTTISSK